MDSSRWKSGREYCKRMFKQTEAIMFGLLSLLVTAVVLYVMGVEALPTRVMLVLTIVAVFVATFEVFHEVRVERDQKDEEVKASTASRPKCEIVGQKYVTLFVNGSQLFNVLQLWFCNDPDYRNVHSVAKNVTIKLTFFAENSVNPLFSYASQWVDAVDPEVASFVGRSPYVDIPANDDPVKCIVLLKHSNDENCYAHSFGKLIGTPDGRYAPYMLRPGRYRLNVMLRGDNIEQGFDRVLVNRGGNGDPEFIGVTQRSDVAIQSPTFEGDGL